MMVAAVSGAASTPKTPSLDETQQNPTRPPLLPSERDNNGVYPKKPKSRQVSSRYMSPSTSSSSTPSSISSSAFLTPRRCPSPLISRNSTPVPNNRSVSVDRRRPTPSRRDLDPKPGNAGGEVSVGTKQLFTATRSLSVSFQGEAFSLPISKTKAAPAPPLVSLRKGTPERRRPSTPQTDNSKPIDQHRWPARTRQANPLPKKLNVIGSGNAIEELQQSCDGKLGLELEHSELLKSIHQYPDGNSNESSFPSDSDSVSSGSSTSGGQDYGGFCTGRSVVSAKFWQDTNSRTPLPKGIPKMVIPPKFGRPKKFPIDNPIASPRTMSSPARGSIRPSSPSKLRASLDLFPSRGMPSPSKVRSSISNNYSETPSVLSFAVDVKRGKVGENRIVDAHLLRLLYNRQLQWRFVNARTEAALSAQKRIVQKNLWNAWITISDLRDSVTKRRHRLHLLRQKLKLASILNGQITCLEVWASLDKDHCISLLGAVEALKGSTLRLPVVGGAIADVESVKDAIGSAVDVMQAMASSICSLLSKVEEVNFLVAELAKEMAEERDSLKRCKDFLTMFAALQVKYCSLRTQILQLNRISAA